MASAGQNPPPPPNPTTPGPKHKYSLIPASSPTSTEWLDSEDSPSSVGTDHGDIRDDLAAINGRLDTLQIRLDSIEPRIPSAEKQQKQSRLLANIDERVQRIPEIERNLLLLPEIEKHLQKLLDSTVALELHFIKSEQQQDQVQHLGRMDTRFQTTVNTIQPTNARFERLENLMTAVMEIIRRTAPVPSLPPSHLTASVDRRASNIGRANTGGGKQIGSFGNRESGRGVNPNDVDWNRDNTGGGANMGGGVVVHLERNVTGINPPQPSPRLHPPLLQIARQAELIRKDIGPINRRGEGVEERRCLREKGREGLIMRASVYFCSWIFEEDEVASTGAIMDKIRLMIRSSMTFDFNLLLLLHL
jgi:hypothetical protein